MPLLPLRHHNILYDAACRKAGNGIPMSASGAISRFIISIYWNAGRRYKRSPTYTTFWSGHVNTSDGTNFDVQKSNLEKTSMMSFLEFRSFGLV